MAIADVAQLAELLQALNSPDNAPRQKAETLYQQAKQANPAGLVTGLVAVLGCATIDEAVRRHGAVLLRQLVTAGSEKDFAFARLSLPQRQEVASELLRLFEQEAEPKLRRQVGEVVSKLAEHVCDKSDTSGSLVPGTNGWPALLPLIFRMADAASCPSEDACESAFHVLHELVGGMREDIVAARQQLEQIIQHGFAHVSLRLRGRTLQLVCEIISQVEKEDWAPLLVTAGAMVQVLQQLASGSEQELLQGALTALLEVATVEPDFFKVPLSQTLEPAQFLSKLARTPDGAETGLRSMALEWLVTYLERRTNWLAKHLKAYLPLVLESCMSLMVEIEDGEEELKAWAEHIDNEEGEEDEDELFHAGADAINRTLQAAGISSSSSSLFDLVTRYSSQDAWQAKHAALTAVKQCCEYVDEAEHISAMADLCLRHVDHPHPRVRYTALHALGQLANDQAPQFQEGNHQKVLPALLAKMDDRVDRVAAIAISSFVVFGEQFDNSLMLQYAQGYMEKLCEKLQTTQHQGVREESVTAIGIIAGAIEKDFSQYYDVIMPALKQIVMHAVGEKENRLRGKAFECMSLLGLAVGKEKFLPDAREALAEMVRIPLESDDAQREYIKEASERICQCLKKDFAPFLPSLLPGIFKTLQLEEVTDGQAQPKPSTDDDDDDDDDYVQVTVGEGKLMQVKTSQLEDMQQSVQLLQTFASEMEGAFYDWVPSTAEVLLPLLSAADELSMWNEDLQGSVLQAWALLIKAARVGAKERNLPAGGLPAELLRTCLKPNLVLFAESEEIGLLAEAATGLADCIKNAGPNVLNAEEVAQLVSKLFTMIDQSIQRSQVDEQLKSDDKAAARRALQHVADEEGGSEDEQEEEEEQLRRNCEEAVGAIVEVNRAEFLPLLQESSQRISAWLGSKHKVLGLYLGCDLVANLKEQSVPAWPCFMPEVFRTLVGGDDPDARTAAAYTINLAAPLASFAEAAPEAFRRLAQALRSPKRPPKRDCKRRMAYDNAVAALFTLALEQSACCPPEIQAFTLVLERLPLKDDEDEGKKVHQKLVDLMVAEHPGLLGGPGAPHLGRALSVLAEVYHVEEICKQETEAKILQVFQKLPQEMLVTLASSFTEKQQKKIEKMLLG